MSLRPADPQYLIKCSPADSLLFHTEKNIDGWRVQTFECSVFFQSYMNLPPDKLQLLSQYDNDKKWELVCDQVRAHQEERDTFVGPQQTCGMVETGFLAPAALVV